MVEGLGGRPGPVRAASVVWSPAQVTTDPDNPTESLPQVAVDGRWDTPLTLEGVHIPETPRSLPFLEQGQLW